jgi:plasmid stabilization system protein ParE
MSRRLIIRPAAEQDLSEAAHWYEERGAGLGKEYLFAVDQTIETILERPLTFQEIEQGIRRAAVRRFPYGVYFIADEVAVTVLAVLHGSRNPTHWRRRS